MPYLPGGTLKEKLKGKPISWLEAVRLLLPIAKALAYAHRRNIVHRDVKPSNILITDEGEPMLSDFGVAKILQAEETQELTGTGVGIGTPEYMAPEQFKGGPIDGRADIYALGVVFYETLTGRRPYEADTPAAIIWKQASEPLPRPSKFAPGIPDKMELIVVKALAKDQKNRYQNMDEFTLALQRLLPEPKLSPAIKEQSAQIKQAAQPASPPRSMSATFLSKRVLWLIGACGIVLLVTGWLFGRGSSGQNPGFSPLTLFSRPTATVTATLTLTPTRTPTPTKTPTPTPSATPPPIYVEGKNLFNADFETNGIGGWSFSAYPRSANPKQYWSIQPDTNNNHFLVGAPASGVEAWLFIGSSSWKDYAIQFRTNVRTSETGGGDRGLEIAFRNSPGIAGCGGGYVFGFGKSWYLVTIDVHQSWLSLSPAW